MCQLKTIACLAGLLVLSAAASAQQDVINTFAGGGPNNVPATSANASDAIALATDGSGNYYFAIAGEPEVRVFKVNASGVLTVLAGNGFAGYSGDGGPGPQAELNVPSGIAADSSGNVYIADTDNCLVRKVDTSGAISTFAGTPGQCGYAGDGGLATSA
jgi:internalin A